jgi:hypothetical protein
MIARSGGNMAEWEFWMLVGLIVVGIFANMQSLDHAASSITRKLDDLIYEIRDVKSKLDKP